MEKIILKLEALLENKKISQKQKEILIDLADILNEEGREELTKMIDC